MSDETTEPLWRRWLITYPATGFDWLWRGYWLLIAALAILCFVNAALWALAYVLHVPLP